MSLLDPPSAQNSNIQQVVKLLVGNKVDKERVVTRAQAEEYARSKGMLFLEARYAARKKRDVLVLPQQAKYQYADWRIHRWRNARENVRN